ncbi:MAG: FHA domain-containing protein [Pseudomonadales bacterium]|nr:FHA domain-containing protein [Pseudomonadales bacterium]
MGKTEQKIDDATLMQPTNVTSRYLLRSLEEGIEYPVNVREVLIGREVECQVPLRAGHVSRYHAKITLTAHAPYIEDLQSTNGTFVNGKKVVGRQQISIGDDIRFHDQHFRLTSAESGDADATLLSSFDSKSVDDTQPRITAQPQSQTIEAPAQPVIRPLRPQQTTQHALPPRERRARKRPHTSQEEPDGDQTSLLSMNELQSLAERSSKSQKVIAAGAGPRFIVLTAPIRGKIFPLKQDAPIGRQWDVGRSQDAAITLEDKTISHCHARVINTPNGWLITTASAKNGVMMNGLSVTRAFLSHNDRIRLGRIELVFMTDEGETPSESIYDLPAVETGYNKGLVATIGITALVIFTLLIALAIH